MGRISDAFKRISPSSTSGVPDAAPMLDEYARERHSRHDEPMATVAAVAAPKPAVHRAAPTPIAATQEFVAAAPRVTPPAPEAETERLIDVQQLGNYIGFVGRAVLRNRVIAAGTLGLMLVATVAGARFWPKTYEVDARLLLQRNEVMASLVNPGRTISREAESPTHAAEEIVLQRDNLLSLIKETDLVKEWDRSRAGLLRVKDWIFGLFRPITDEDRLDAMVGLLEKRLVISATPEGAVTFNLLWPDGQVAYQMVDRAIQNFLQVRKQNETSAIADSIAILDRSVQTLEAQVSQTMSELPKRRPVVAPVKRPAPNPAALLPPTPAGPPAELVARAAKTKAALDAKVEEVTRLDTIRRQQLAEAQGRLAQATAVYTEGHPTIVALRQNIAQLQREPADLTAARRDAQNLEAEYEAVSGVIQSSRSEAEEATRKATFAALGAAEPQQPIDYGALTGAAEAGDPISLRLKVELSELATVRERANAARAELSSAQAGFKYQYSMIRPPQVPRRPASPNVPAILAAGALASLLLAVVAAVAIDVARGRILEPWQVESLVGVPVSVRL